MPAAYPIYRTHPASNYLGQEIATLVPRTAAPEAGVAAYGFSKMRRRLAETRMIRGAEPFSGRRPAGNPGLGWHDPCRRVRVNPRVTAMEGASACPKLPRAPSRVSPTCSPHLRLRGR